MISRYFGKVGSWQSRRGWRESLLKEKEGKKTTHGRERRFVHAVLEKSDTSFFDPENVKNLRVRNKILGKGNKTNRRRK